MLCTPPCFALLQCATLQHPFEARNQCALILKIIEAKVKMPAGVSVSLELRNLILWLLQKDPDTRPSAKDVLCEVR
jgi:serine/threonine protein kinase